jgi:hypothetical protein
MKLTFFVILTLTLGIAHSQTLKKYAVSNSGCSVYMYCDPGKFDVDFSEDSSKVYTAQCDKDGVTYGIICIKLLVPVSELNSAEELVISYLDYLKADFHIKKAAGYGKGHQLSSNPNTRGILDYWDDADGNHWKVKAWTDGKIIGVLFAYSKKELVETKADVFLNSFKLPG